VGEVDRVGVRVLEAVGVTEPVCEGELVGVKVCVGELDGVEVCVGVGV
jgi:hypothetical protein